MDRTGQKWTEDCPAHRAGVQWTEVDRGGQRWIEVDRGGQRWTEVDRGG